MSDYGIKISPNNYDVKTSTPQNTSFSSKYNQLKIAFQGSFSLTVNSGNTDGYFTLNHGLGYAPLYFVYVETVAGSGIRYQIDYFDSSSNVYASAYNDLNNLTVNIHYSVAPEANKTHQGYYFVFIDN
jgi:hypothetical protein